MAPATKGLQTTAVLILLVLVVLATYVTCEDCANPTAVLTYNAGLSTTVYGYEQRREPVVEALKSLENHTDFMCLQEFWFEEDVQNVLEQLEPLFPHHYSAIHHSVGQLRDSTVPEFWKPPGYDTMPCSPKKLSKLMKCFDKKCSEAENAQACLLQKCGNKLYRLSQKCRSCFSVSFIDPLTIWEKCANYFVKYNRLNQPGLLVLSKQPLTSAEYVNYHPGYPMLVEKGYIEAQVEGGHTYVCTHHAAVFPLYFEVGLPLFNSFLEMNEAEIRHINDTYYGMPIVAVGDFNTGPERSEPGLPSLDGEAAPNYDILVNEMNYQNPYLQNNGSCTFCASENPILLALNDQSGDVAIDFVFTSPGVSADITSAKRVLDPPGVWLSDHFGVMVDVCAP